MIIRFGVDRPYFLAVIAFAENKVYGLHRCQRRMIHIVITVHTVPADKIEIVNGIYVIFDISEFVIGSEVSRISFLDTVRIGV